jgi:YidC/Oxa1 family membrane protein insertase
MEMVLLAATTNIILKPFAWILSFIINAVYYVVQLLTVNQSMAITIVLFTLVVRALMTPLTMKQQRSSRKMQRLQPKVQAIQDKYKSKKDPESQQKMQAELSALYKKNNTSPMSGCLPLLIQMPILFALYEILRNVPFYVNGIGDIFNSMATQVMGVSGYADIITDNFSTVTKSLTKFDVTTMDSVMDFLYHLTREQWVSFKDLIGLAGNATFESAYQLQESINTVGTGIFTFNLAEAPGWKGVGIIIPLLAGICTFLQTFISTKTSEKRAKIANPNGTQNDMQGSMKMMMYVTPVMIAFFAISMPTGLGIYWIASSVFGTLFQLLADKIIDREEYKEVLRKKQEFEEKKLFSYTIHEGGSGKDSDSRYGTMNTSSKSSMAGNKMAALAQRQKEQQEKRESYESSVQEEE